MAYKYSLGVKFFAQRINEMLFDRTRHMNKAPVLNTYLLSKEYLRTSRYNTKPECSNKHLDSILEEFKDSIIRDPVFRKNIGIDTINYYVSLINKNSPSSNAELMEYFVYKYQDYNKWCIEYIKEVVQTDNYHRIDMGIRCLLPALIDIGFSPEYIYYYNKQIFIDRRNYTSIRLNMFLERFLQLKKEYYVYFPLEKQAIQFRDTFEGKMGIFFVDDCPFEELIPSDGYRLVKTIVKEFDAQKAADKAFAKISFFFRYYCFLENKNHEWFESKCLVIDENTKKSLLEFGNKQLKIPRSYDEKEAGAMSEDLISFLLNKGGSFSVIDKAIKNYYSALEANNLRDSFLNLWSILETLFTVSNDNKINQIEKRILPILQFDYLSNMFNDIEFLLKRSIGKKRYELLISKCHSIQSLLLLDDNRDLLNDLLEEIQSYPLVISKIYYALNVLENKKTLNKELERYTKRVHWHLIRLYRTRNQIIHNGDNPFYLKYLCAHLCEYVEASIQIIIQSLIENPQLCFIANVYLDIQTYDNKLKELLKTGDSFNQDDISKLLYF